MTVSPSTLTAKMTIRTISGARIRRRIRKTVADAFAADAAATRTDALLARRSSWSVLNRRVQKASSGLPTTVSDQPRWNDTVSMTSRTTETMLASSAPPDSDTTLAVQAAVIPAVET